MSRKTSRKSRWTWGSSTNGYIYIAWNDDRSGNSDIYFTRSINGGSTFASAIPIAAMAQDEFFPQITISSTHVVYVTYYRRTSQAVTTFNAYMILSADAGQTWSTPLQINDGGNISPVDFGGGFIGDYIGIDTGTTAQGPRINAVWMDSRRNQQDIYSISAAGC